MLPACISICLKTALRYTVLILIPVSRTIEIYVSKAVRSASQWPRGLRRRSAAARLLGLWVRIPPEGHGCLSVVSVGSCEEEDSARGLSHVQGRPTDSGTSLCVI